MCSGGDATQVSEVCKPGVVLQSTETSWVIILGTCILMMLCILVVAVIIKLPKGRVATTPRHFREVGSQTESVKIRTVLTQSQATYEWHLATPRFRALQRDNDHGAWAEAPRFF